MKKVTNTTININKFKARWSPIEEYIFYNSLREFGMNNSILKNILTLKNIKHIKNKTKKTLCTFPTIFKRLMHSKSNLIQKSTLINLIQYNIKYFKYFSS